MQQQLTIGTLLHCAYKIERILGQGSFGITYLGTHLALNKKVAIKEFFMKGLNTREADASVTEMEEGSLQYNYAQKFKKEALNLALLDHPNIVRVTDSFEENGTFYYVMDYIEGQNLNDYIKSNFISEAEAIDIIKSVADALIYMHETHHMLHLDLKPGNVMRRTSDGHIFLIDFGLSKHFSGKGAPETSTSIGLGTPGYAPIEQENNSRRGDFRPTIDIYALGATLYKLLTYETPPVASELVSDENILESNLVAKGISRNLINSIMVSMAPNVTKRYQSVRSFKNALTTNFQEDERTQIDGDETRVVEENTHSTNTGKASEQKKKRKSSKYTIIGVIGIAIVAILLYMGKNNNSTGMDISNTTDTIHVENYPTKIMGDFCVYTGSAIQSGDSICTLTGRGEIKFNDGRSYKGPIKQGTLTGDNVVFTYSNGDTFQGSFENDHFSKGKYTVKKTGEYFIGSFETNGQPYKGTWYESMGRKIEDVNN